MGMYVPGIDYMTDQASWLAVQNGQGPFAPNMPGTVRYTYTGRGRHTDASDITVNGEINKLASNIGQARDFAGIHWRSDYEQGLLLGEAVALSVLRDQSNNYVGENFAGFTITKFDGTTITV